MDGYGERSAVGATPEDYRCRSYRPHPPKIPHITALLRKRIRTALLGGGLSALADHDKGNGFI